MSDNTNTETADTTGWWIPLLAVVGMAAGGLSYATNTAALGLVGALVVRSCCSSRPAQEWDRVGSSASGRSSAAKRKTRLPSRRRFER